MEAVGPWKNWIFIISQKICCFYFYTELSNVCNDECSVNSFANKLQHKMQHQFPLLACTLIITHAEKNYLVIGGKEDKFSFSSQTWYLTGVWIIEPLVNINPRVQSCNSVGLLMLRFVVIVVLKRQMDS